jgi:hypothetical protein
LRLATNLRPTPTTKSTHAKKAKICNITTSENTDQPLFLLNFIYHRLENLPKK